MKKREALRVVFVVASDCFFRDESGFIPSELHERDSNLHFWQLSLGSFRWDVLAWELSLGISRLGTFA